MRLNLENKVVLVTGGSRGIGASICRTYIQEGSKVYFTYKSNDEAANQLIESVKEIYPNASIEAIKADINDFETCEIAVQKILDGESGIDILVNNAGITSDGMFLLQSFEEWYQVLQTDLIALTRLTNLVSFSMLTNQKGSIVNVSSIAGLKGVKGQTNYCTAKAGIVGFTKAMANEFGSKGIRTNAVAPGYIETEMTKDLRKSNITLSHIPMKRMGTVEEVANVVVFISSDAGSYINGVVVVVDGGLIS